MVEQNLKPATESLIIKMDHIIDKAMEVKPQVDKSALQAFNTFADKIGPLSQSAASSGAKIFRKGMDKLREKLQ